jgi:hypothetical protein
MACGQNFLHLLVRSVRVLLALELKMCGGTGVVLGDDKAETFGG